MRSRRLIPPLLLALALFSPSVGAQDAEPMQLQQVLDGAREGCT